jgi:hypothetical protein
MGRVDGPRKRLAKPKKNAKRNADIDVVRQSCDVAIPDQDYIAYRFRCGAMRGPVFFDHPLERTREFRHVRREILKDVAYHESQGCGGGVCKVQGPYVKK